jgi:uncharacterized membrane protein (UPF0127 family)
VIVQNADRGSVLGTAIEVAETSSKRAKGLLGRDHLATGEGLLFKHCSSLHTFFMRFAIDIAYIAKNGRVLKIAHSVPPFRICAAPLRAHYALELPAGSLAASHTKVKDMLRFVEEYEVESEPGPLQAAV